MADFQQFQVSDVVMAWLQTVPTRVAAIARLNPGASEPRLTQADKNAPA